MLHITKLTEFKKEVIEEKIMPVLVDFYADWCGPCKMLAPVIEQFAKENEKVKVVKVDVDAAQELAQEYGVMSIPTVYVFKQGKPTKQMVGYQDLKTLEGAIR